MGKKNLDKLFQEKLSDFVEAPDEKVWQSIEASLDKKKKSKRVIPLWWKLGGVAAVLAFGIYLMDPFGNEIDSSPAITDIERPDGKSTIDSETKEVEDALENSNREVTKSDGQQPLNTDNKNQIETLVSSENEVGTTKMRSNDRKPVVSSETTQVAQGYSNGSEEHTMTQDSNTSDTDNPTLTSSEAVANTALDDSTLPEVGEANSQERNLPGTQGSNAIQIVENESESEEAVVDQKKKSIFDEIAEQEQEKEVASANKGGKWSAGPSVAPVYFDALGQGSPVHSIFVPNSKSGDLNLSYGLSVAYEINDKLKIRSGVHRVDYGYSTDDVEFSSSLESAAVGQITNVNYSATGKNIVVASSATNASSDAVENIVPLAQDFSGQGLSQNGAMTQQFGYLEVPVELEYALLDKKVGVNLIGGFSSLFLVDNSISLSAGELTTQMGEANNVNNVNFSTNVGIGVNYKFSPKVQLNVEPVFKYQLNTFSRTEGTFQPFTVGVYSGVSFKF